MTEPLSLDTGSGSVSALLDGSHGGPLLVLAHGAGGDMRTELLTGLAEGLAEDGVACLRFNFVYSESARQRPDREPLLRAAWSAAFELGRGLGGPIWVGGKSMGGRIASMMVADGSMPAAGLVLLGYPLHPPGKPERIRDAHLPDIGAPMLFLQGTADPLGRWDLVEATLARLGDLASLHRIEGGDHSFRVRGQPRDDAGRGRELAGVAARFILDHS